MIDKQLLDWELAAGKTAIKANFPMIIIRLSTSKL